MKSEFGFFKNDTTVKIYQEKTRQKEVIEMQFGPEDEKDVLDVKKPVKDSKLKTKLKTMKEESDKNKQTDIEFEVD